jgi:hypothetical protein
VAKQRSVRISCLSNERQFLLACHLYAQDNDQWLPSGASDYGGGDEAVPVLSTPVRKEMVELAGNYKMLGCPSLGAPFNTQQGWVNQGYGYVLGYNYLGGHTNTPWPALVGTNTWLSPQKLTGDPISSDPSAPLLTEENDWSPGYGGAVAPHTHGAAILMGSDFNTPDPQGRSSADLGAAGGNIGLLDGSAAWKPIKLMQTYRGSQLYGPDGCWAMW